VVIATPSATHAHLGWLALERGRHVLVEKPITTDALTLERLLASALRAERTVMVNHLLLYHPAFTALQAALAEGLIGDVLAINAHRLSPAGDRDECPWWSLAPHDLALIDRIAPDLLTGSVKTENRAGELRVRLEFASRRAFLRVGHCGSRKVRLFVVQGSRGALVFDDMDAHKLKLHAGALPCDERSSEDELTLRKRLGPGRPLRCGAELPLDASLQHFVAAIAAAREPLSGAEHARRILAALLRVKAFQEPQNPAAALEIVA
jgi:predicted dehydrogenase